MRWARLFVLLPACGLLLACHFANAGEKRKDKKATDEAELSASERSAKKLDPELKKVVELARQDLSKHLAAKVAAIDLVSAERVTWRDSSAGCPEPDRMYMQVLTEGARIVLTVSGREYRYHQVTESPPFRCENPSKVEPLPGPIIE